MLNYKRYKRVPVVDYPQRQWPNKQIEKAPIWCSVDLRDGNQALIEPMTVDEKVEMFNLLLKLGFKEIEIGFPAASQIEFDFLRKLVAENMIPDDVNPVVLCQNVDKGAQTRKVCSTGCIGCMKCTKYCPTNAISVQNNLAYIDQELCIGCMQCADECPVKAIHIPNIRKQY